MLSMGKGDIKLAERIDHLYDSLNFQKNFLYYGDFDGTSTLNIINKIKPDEI